MLSDFSHAARLLLRSPRFTALAVLTFALGIGANGVVFSSIKSVLYAKLPFRDPDTLVRLSEFTQSDESMPASFANFLEWQQQTGIFESMGASRSRQLVLSGHDGSEVVGVNRVTRGYLQTLGIAPLAGRGFLPEEDLPGGRPVLMLAESFWRERFGSSASALGQTLRLSGTAYSIVGVVPDGYRLFGQVFLPLGPVARLEPRPIHDSLYPVARLKAGVTLAQAQRRMEEIALAAERQYPEFETGHRISVMRLREAEWGGARPAIALIAVVVALILFIACANVSSLLLGRSVLRTQEVALRSALGAPRSRLIRQFLAESLLLAALGGALGILLCDWGCAGLTRLVNNPDELPPGGLTPDWTIALATFALAFLAGLLAGLLPAWRLSEPDLNRDLKTGVRHHVSGRRGLVRQTLVTLEVAAAVLVLIAAALELRSFYHLVAIDLGFDPHHVLTLRLARASRYASIDQEVTFQQRLLAEVDSMPGVVAAATGSPIPAGNEVRFGGFYPEDRPKPPPGQMPDLLLHNVSVAYARVVGLRPIAGRWFRDADYGAHTSVAVINETMARRTWPGRDALQQRFNYDGRSYTVVGVMADTREENLTPTPSCDAYFLDRAPSALLLKTALDPGGLVKAIQKKVAELDPQQAVFDAATLDQRVESGVMEYRVVAQLVAIFGALALALACVGIYGVVAQATAERTYEIGIRIAMGAGSADIWRLVLGQALLPVSIGFTIGIGGAIALTRMLATMLFGMRALDPASLIAAPFLLGLVALAACSIPAFRAMHLDPVAALRHE